MTRSANARALANALIEFALLSIVALGVPLWAQQLTGAGTPQPRSEEIASAKAAPEAPKSSLSQFAWLAGHWQGQWGPRLAQQVWMPPQSATMVGVFQVSENAQKQVVELYTIVSTPRGVELRIRRFTPTLTPWEKSGPALLDLKSIDSKSILFENANDGQPKSWLMTRTGANTFVERFEVVSEKGQRQIAQIVYRRRPAPSPPGR
jgi:hypothetical protein